MPGLILLAIIGSWLVSQALFGGLAGRLLDRFGLAGGAAGDGGAGGGGGGGAAGRGGRPGLPRYSPEVEQWRPLVARYFPAAYVDQALSVLNCESSGNPNAVNPSSRASGLFQHLPRYYDGRAAAAGFAGASIFNPEANIAAAAYLFGQTNTWRHWSCKPVS